MDDVIKYKLNNGESYDGYENYEKAYNYYIKLIASYIRRLEKKGGEDYKIKHIKKYYKIFSILNTLIKIIYNELQDDDYHCDGITDMYKFLKQTLSKIMDDIFKHIKFFQDDNFINDDYYEHYIWFLEGEYKGDFDIEKWHNYFTIYSHLKHYI